MAASCAVERHVRSDAGNGEDLLQERSQARTSTQTRNARRHHSDRSGTLCGCERRSERNPAILPRNGLISASLASFAGNHFPVYAILQIEFEPSSVTSSEPSGATVIPPGRPHTLPSGRTKPV